MVKRNKNRHQPGRDNSNSAEARADRRVARVGKAAHKKYGNAQNFPKIAMEMYEGTNKTRERNRSRKK